MKPGRAGILIVPVPVDSGGIIEIRFSGTAERFNSEHVAFFHALVGLCLHEWDLFVAVDLVMQDVMTRDVSNRLYGDDLPVELNLVALHYLLDCLTDVSDPGVNACFLIFPLAFAQPYGVKEKKKIDSHTLSPALVASLTAASKLS